MKQVKMHDSINDKLSELSEVRRENGELIKTKQDIVADLIIKAHKKECK